MKYTDMVSYVHILCLCVFPHLISSVLVIEDVGRNIRKQLFFWYLKWAQKSKQHTGLKKLCLQEFQTTFAKPTRSDTVDTVRRST